MTITKGVSGCTPFSFWSSANYKQMLHNFLLQMVVWFIGLATVYAAISLKEPFHVALAKRHRFLRKSPVVVTGLWGVCNDCKTNTAFLVAADWGVADPQGSLHKFVNCWLLVETKNTTKLVNCLLCIIQFHFSWYTSVDEGSWFMGHGNEQSTRNHEQQP